MKIAPNRLKFAILSMDRAGYKERFDDGATQMLREVMVRREAIATSRDLL